MAELIGDDAVHTKKLATELTDVSHKVIVRMASNLNMKSLEVDYIALMLDLTSQESLKKVESLLSRINMRQYFGKTGLIATNYNNIFGHCIGLDVIQNLAESFHIPVLYVNMESSDELRQIVVQLLNLAKLPVSGKNSTLELMEAIR